MLAISQLSMRFGAKILFKNVSLQFNIGNRYGLVGANGCGKSTLIKILTGEMTPEKGDVILPQQMTIGSLKQDHYLFQKTMILDVVLQGRKKLWEALTYKHEHLKKESFSEEDCEKLAKWEKIIEKEGGYSAEAEAAKILEGLGVRTEWHFKPLDSLSGGYKLRVLLAQVLFGQPQILLLDEPTNHLDLYSIRWLENYLSNFQGTLILTSHDRQFINGICTHIADVDYGTIKIYPGNYEEFHKQKELDRELKEQMLQKHDKRRTDLQDFIDRFGAKATKARQAQSKARLVEKIEDEMEALEILPSSRIYPKIHFEPLRSSGVTVLTVKDVCKAYGPKKVLENVSFEVERGEKIGIIGPNGIGKSTLLEILTANQNADRGNFTWGHAAKWAYFPQDHKREVYGSWTLLDWLGQFDRELPQEKLRELLGRVLFSGETVNQPIATLSGGETARLLLAKIMLAKPNVLIFDEPTNHLDMEAIEELTSALDTFEGTLIFVSHNRFFVSSLAKRIIELSEKGVKEFRGNYQEYLEKENSDHLTTNGALNQRYAKDQKPVSSDYLDQKKIKSQKAQLKKKVSLAEESCHKLENQIKNIEQDMAAPEFYLKTERDQQLKLAQRKIQLEEDLNRAMELWETLSLQLQNCEGIS